VRTIKHDVDFMKYRLNPPIEYDSLNRGADYDDVVDFDDWATDLLRGRKWHGSQLLL